MKKIKESGFYYVLFLFAFMILMLFAIRHQAIPYTAIEMELSSKKYNIDVFHNFRGQVATVFAIASVLYLCVSLLTKDISLFFDRYLKLLLGISAMVTVSFLLSPYKNVAWKGTPDNHESFLVVLSYFAIAIVVSQIKMSPSQKKLLVHVLNFIAVVTSVVAILQFFKINPLEWDIIRFYSVPTAMPHQDSYYVNNGMAYSFFGNPNYLGSIMVILLPFTVYRTLQAGGKSRAIIAYSVLSLSYFSLLASQSLAGILSAPVAIVFMYYAYKNSDYGKTIVGCGVLTVTQICYLILQQNDPGVRVSLSLTCLIVIVILLKPVIVRHVKLSIKFVLIVLLLISIGSTYHLSGMSKSTSDNFLNGVYLKNGEVTVDSGYGILHLKMVKKKLLITDADDNVLSFKTKESVITIDDKKYSGYSFEYKNDSGFDVLKIMPFGVGFFALSDEFKFINLSLREGTIEHPKSVGPEGYERLASGRIYIWQRTLPLIAKRPIGYGPDCFFVAFPQSDVTGKYNMGGNPYIIVDKPHSLYLGYAVNYGVVALLLYFSLVYLVLRNGLKVLMEMQRSSVLAPMLASVISFQVVSLANDSKIYTSIYYWILMGATISIIRSQGQSTETMDKVKRVVC